MSSNTLTAVEDWAKEQIEGRSRQDWISDIGPFVMLIALFVFFSATTFQFLTYDNLISNVAQNSVVILLIALAGTFPILQGSIDLSVDSMLLLGAIVTVIAITDFQLGILAIPVALGMGMLAGLGNGIIFTKLKVPSFLVTLGTRSVLTGVGLILTGGATLTVRNPSLQGIATGTWIPFVPNLVLWGLIIYAFCVYLAWKTKFGRYCFAIGENERVVELSGAKVDRYKIYAFVLSGFLASSAGVLLALRISAASSSIASGVLLPSIAAIVMGGTALTGGVGGPHRTILGVLVITILQNGMSLIGIDSFVQQIIIGLVVVFAVALSIDRKKIDVVK